MVLIYNRVCCGFFELDGEHVLTTTLDESLSGNKRQRKRSRGSYDLTARLEDFASLYLGKPPDYLRAEAWRKEDSIIDSNKKVTGIDGVTIPEPGIGSLVDDTQYWKQKYEEVRLILHKERNNHSQTRTRKKNLSEQLRLAKETERIRSRYDGLVRNLRCPINPYPPSVGQ